jgi:hypothetical protein
MLAMKEAAITMQVWVNTQELQCCIGQQGCGFQTIPPVRQNGH